MKPITQKMKVKSTQHDGWWIADFRKWECPFFLLHWQKEWTRKRRHQDIEMPRLDCVLVQPESMLNTQLGRNLILIL